MLQENPAAHVAGLILEGGTRWAEPFRRAREQLLDRAAGAFDVATLVHYDSAVELLREWSPDHATEQLEGVARQKGPHAPPCMYVFVLTPAGARLGTVPLPRPRRR